MASPSWTTLRHRTRPNSATSATCKLRLPHGPDSQFAAAARPHTHTNAEASCLGSTAPSTPCRHASLRSAKHPRAQASGAAPHRPIRASKACSAALPRRSAVHGRTHAGHTARHAVAGPANRSFASSGTVFPYMPRSTPCCNRFVMSLSHSPPFKQEPRP